MKVFIIESASPLEIIKGRTEGGALKEICEMMDYDVLSFFVKSKDEFIEICNYLSSIECVVREKSEDEPICIHLSFHGDEGGIQIGRDKVDWKDIADCLYPMFNMDYSEDILLSISACGADNCDIHYCIENLIAKNGMKPPRYIFIIDEEEVLWRDAILNWTILYHQIVHISTSVVLMKDLLNRISVSGFGNLKYFRWSKTRKKFVQYSKGIREQSTILQ
ncbi:hypothetical protein [Bacillus massiliigorillae]|uniref:hypothetical protein n=1 Tax=Bacillus massiliigorillae TaxID=1243664 RepID=UPI0003A71940|nr:hypothetical protein [Bacillus massiliigorillae]